MMVAQINQNSLNSPARQFTKRFAKTYAGFDNLKSPPGRELRDSFCQSMHVW